jgi:hypothetical protein
MPFDVRAEGRLSQVSRGDWTPLELFIVVVRNWEGRLWQILAGENE